MAKIDLYDVYIHVPYKQHPEKGLLYKEYSIGEIIDKNDPELTEHLKRWYLSHILDYVDWKNPVTTGTIQRAVVLLEILNIEPNASFQRKTK